MNFSRVVVIVTVTAAIVYAGLNFLLPRHAKAPAVETASSTEAGVVSEAPAAAEAAPADDNAAEATAEDPALTEEEARRIAANVASEVATRVNGEAAAPEADSSSAFAEPAADASASSADAGADELTDEQKSSIAANVASESSGAAEAEAEEAAPAPAPAPKARTAATSAPAAKSAKPAAKSASAAAPTGKLGNGQDVISAWWKKAPSSEHLNLVYAGEASSEKAVVLLFDSAVDAASVGDKIKLIDAKGAAPAGSWSNGGNSRVVAFKGVPAGRYTVIVAPDLADTGGKTVGTEMVGPVYVR